MMRRMRWAALAFCALAAAPQPVAAQVFNPTTYTLANGLEVVVVENHRAPIANQMVWYKVGSADEIPGKSGLAHLLEHLMFKGTPSIPPGEFSKIVARAGGRDNAFTSTDYTAYYENIAADRLDLTMKLEADRMRNLAFEEGDFTTERAVVEEERRSRTDNSPAALLSERMEAALFLNHPYHRPVIGWEQEIAGLTRQDALEFYHKWYAPNNAILVVAGDVTPEKVKQLAETYFGPIPRADTPVRDRLKEPPQIGARLVTLKDPRVEQPNLSRLYLAPSDHYGDADVGPKESAYALEVLSEIVGGSATSRLYRSLVVDQGLAADASASYDPTAYDYATFGIVVVPRPGVAMDKVQRAFDAELTRILKEGIGPDEVQRAKDRLAATVAYARDSLHTGTHVLGAALATGQTVTEVEAWPERIAAVTPDQVNAAAKALFDENRSVTGILLPEAAVSARAKPAAPVQPSREIR
ncbi:MAG: pitrilysin family protein [Magnetospirillum sp.]|nr:pitrilysin family protein [Magnetospirillum sp.]